MSKPIIQLKNVWKTYFMGETQLDVLKDVTVDIFPHEFVAIVGPSGSGKSTLMNLVGALDVPSKGEVLLEGRNISQLSESDLANLRGKKIGFIFQQFNLISTLTALENVILPTIFQNMPESVRVQRATKLLSSFGLGDRLNHKPTELSGGQQQRVAIARALVNNPEVLLADEPTGNLDSKSGEQVMTMLHEFNKREKKTVILVTHDINLVKSVDRTFYLKDGEVVKITKNHH